MTKSPVMESIAGKFNECKEAVNEQMRKNAIIGRIKRQILEINKKNRHVPIELLSKMYYEAICQLYYSLESNEVEFWKAFRKVIYKVGERINKKAMICAIAQFCSEHPAELSPGILYDYAERWHSIENNLFSLVNRINYKPFWDWMIRHKIDDFDLEELISDGEFTFEDTILWIASDEEYTEEFFETSFDFFMEQTLRYIEYSADYNNPITLEKAFRVIFSILPQYEVRILNYTYLYYMSEEEYESLTVNDFIYILNHMADYEYVTGEKTFSCARVCKWPTGGFDGYVDVVQDAKNIIFMHSANIEVAEIVWILQNRFGIEESVINDAIAKAAIEEFAGGNLNDLLYTEKLAPLFQFPVAYNLFLLYFDDIVKNTAKYAFKELEEKYGVECEIVKI